MGLFFFYVKVSFGVVLFYIYVKYMYGNIFSFLKFGIMVFLGFDWFFEEEG